MDNPAAIDRLKAKAEARAAIVNEIAKILWENGEMLADTEGGSMPSWDEVLTNRRAEGIGQELKEAYWSWFLAHTHQAEALLNLGVTDSLTLAKHLIDNAMRTQRSVELGLWHKIERAKGFEPGSLAGAPGVPQRAAL